MSENLLAVPGSSVLVNGTLTGYPNPAKEIEITLKLRTKELATAMAEPLNQILSRPPHLRTYLTHSELADVLGAYPEDVASIETYFQPFGIRVKSKSLLLGNVTLAGSVAAFEQAFHTEVGAYQSNNRALFLATTGYKLPTRLLDMVKEAQPLQHLQRKESRLPVKPLPPLKPGENLQEAIITEPGYSPSTLAKAYQFPEGASGEGQVIGIIELGGKVNQADLKQFFTELGIKKPRIVEVGTAPVNTGTAGVINDGEVSLDIQVAGAIAPQAKLVIYYGNTMLEALQVAIGDEVNQPSVISVSWAGSEYKYLASEVQTMNMLFYQASILGITIVAASADHGAFNGLNTLNVALPASSPLVLACGGSIVTVEDDILTSEVVWNELNNTVASGGGYSQVYTQPTYQNLAVAKYPYQKSAMRGVPDVAADASVINGYRIVLNGQAVAIGGTSGATPFVAGLIALLNEKLGYRLGFINAMLYGFAGSQAFRQITEGNNNFYAAAPYWNPCTGLGSILGTKLLMLLEMLEQASKVAAKLPVEPNADATEDAAQPVDAKS